MERASPSCTRVLAPCNYTGTCMCTCTTYKCAALVLVLQPGRGSPFEQLDTGGSGAANCHAANQAKVG